MSWHPTIAWHSFHFTFYSHSFIRSVIRKLILSRFIYFTPGLNTIAFLSLLFSSLRTGSYVNLCWARRCFTDCYEHGAVISSLWIFRWFFCLTMFLFCIMLKSDVRNFVLHTQLYAINEWVNELVRYLRLVFPLNSSTHYSLTTLDKNGNVKERFMFISRTPSGDFISWGASSNKVDYAIIVDRKMNAKNANEDNGHLILHWISMIAQPFRWELSLSLYRRSQLPLSAMTAKASLVVVKRNPCIGNNRRFYECVKLP